MQDDVDALVRLLDLEPIEVNLFRGVSPDEDRQRVFGGQVAGQALVAAARTVEEPGRMVHSLHAYFLRPGDPKAPILYEVDRIRDGRSFSTRRVVARQEHDSRIPLWERFATRLWIQSSRLLTKACAHTRQTDVRSRFCRRPRSFPKALDSL